MNFTERRERFRAVLAGDECVYTAPVFDLTSARLAEQMGFDLGFMTGPVAQATVVGAPNHHVVVMTSTELAQHVGSMCRITDRLSLYIGAHHGYGNALNVMRTVQELERVGVSALSIDDEVEPIPFGTRFESWGDYHTYVQGGERLISLEEAVGRMKAAVAARQDSSLVIVARTTALRVDAGPPEISDVEEQKDRLSGARGPDFNPGGIAEAIRRINAYEEAGVDAVHLDGAKFAGLEEIRAETRLPLILGDEAALFDREFLARNGVRVGGFGRLTYFASVKAIYDTLKALRDGKSPADLAPDLYAPEVLEAISDLTRVGQYDEWIRAFMN